MINKKLKDALRILIAVGKILKVIVESIEHFKGPP